jgi:lipoprotein signal peptidase
MTALVTALLLVVLIDQALKLLVLHRLGSASISLGLLGRVTGVRSRIWMARAPYRLRLATLWTLWIAGASGLVIVYALFPASGWFCALLLGGSLSHALETSVRGSICDYVCLRFWPAFNLADLAITVGAIGMAASLTKL